MRPVPKSSIVVGSGTEAALAKSTVAPREAAVSLKTARPPLFPD
jgi:hypothetical protein